MLRPSSISVALCAVSTAAAGPWNSPAGTAEHFTYSNGQDVNSHFGEPVISGDSFIFPEFQFSASAQNGSTEAPFDTVSVDLVANPGWTFALTRVSAFGYFSASGNASVDFDALLSFDELAPPGRNWQSSMDTNPTFPKSSDSGPWTGLATIDPSGEEVITALHLEYSNDALALSGPGGSAYIEVVSGSSSGFELAIGMVEIPEPASLVLMACGGLLMSRRSRASRGVYPHGRSTATVPSTREGRRG